MDKFKVIIAGSRRYADYAHLEAACLHFLQTKELSDVEVVSGGARGADQLGEFFAAKHKIDVTRFPADWKQFGRSAGPRRNEQMARYADALIAFPLDRNSIGTRNMIARAKAHGLPVRFGTNLNSTL